VHRDWKSVSRGKEIMIRDIGTKSGFRPVLRITAAVLTLGLILAGCGEVVSVDDMAGGGPGANSLLLSWKAPTTNDDGSALEDLAGYKLYYGTLPGRYSKVIDVGNFTSAVIADLGSGTYYMTVTAYDNNGNESKHSEEIDYTFQ